MTFIFVFAAWIACVCLHEYAHARVAYAGGDTSVAEKGYLTLNPLKYTHPVYSIVMPLIFLALGGIGLPGGAVYVDRSRLRSRAWASAVSVAGPASNLLLAILLALVLKFAASHDSAIWPALAFLVELQIWAVILNLLPIPPMDGFRIIEPYLSASARDKAYRMGMVPSFVLFLLLWYVPAVRNAFLYAISYVLIWLGIPLELVDEGFRNFMAWRFE